jgi:curved DNA-binding protein CbpA
MYYTMIGKGKNPFHILGVSPDASLETVKKAFTRLALRYHPDTAASAANRGSMDSNNNNNSSEARDFGEASSVSAADQFLLIRQAFERIRDGSYYNDEADVDQPRRHSPPRRADAANGPLHRNVHDDYRGGFTEQDFLHYFYQQTGLKLTSAQRRELLHIHQSRVPGGRYDGPSWDIARRLAAEQEVFLQRKSMHRGNHSEGSTTTTGGWTIFDSDNNNTDKNLRRKRRK